MYLLQPEPVQYCSRVCSRGSGALVLDCHKWRLWPLKRPALPGARAMSTGSLAT